MSKPILNCAAILVGASATLFHAQNVVAQTTIENASLWNSDFRKHERTFGLVYTLPKEVNEVLGATIGGLLKEDLLQAGLATEAQRFNIPHVRSSGDDAVAVADHSFCPLARSRRGHYMS